MGGQDVRGSIRPTQVVRRRLWWLACGVLVLLATGFVHLGLKPRVGIVNRSDERLQGVRVRGTGFDTGVSDIPAGASRCVVVEPISESGLELEFRASERPRRHVDLAYLEPGYGYRIHIVVKPDLSLETTGDTFDLRPWCTTP